MLNFGFLLLAAMRSELNIFEGLCCTEAVRRGSGGGVLNRMQDKKASLHTVRLPTVRSARVLRLFSGDGSGGVYRRGWVSRPERTKLSIGAGDVSPTRTLAVQIAKHIYAAVCRVYRPCEIQTGKRKPDAKRTVPYTDKTKFAVLCGCNPQSKSQAISTNLLLKGGGTA